MKFNVSIETKDNDSLASINYNVTKGMAFIWGPESKVKKVLELVQMAESLVIEENRGVTPKNKQ